MDLFTNLGVIVAVIGSSVALYFKLKSTIKDSVKEEVAPTMKPIEEEIKNLQEDVKSMEKSDCKNFLVKFMNDKKNGFPQDEICNARAHEVKDKYKKNNWNSYIIDEWEAVMGEKW